MHEKIYTVFILDNVTLNSAEVYKTLSRYIK